MATPVGTFPCAASDFPATIGSCCPRSDCGARPIDEHDGWCDDPRSTAYNRLVRISQTNGATSGCGATTNSTTWRRRRLCNDDPPEGEWGSAIFLHLARPDTRRPRLRRFWRDDLLELVPLVGPETRLRVLSLPADDAATWSAVMRQFDDDRAGQPRPAGGTGDA